MPGVQEKYTIDVNNRFGIANNEDEAEDEGIENVDPFELISDLNKKAEIAKNAPKPKVQKKKAVEAKPVEVKEESRVEGNNRRGGNRGRGRGGRGNDRPRGPPRTQNGEEGAPQREDRPRGGGRGRGRGGRRPDGERKFDRKSGDPRTSYKGGDVKKGAGAGNWGTTEDELKATTEPTEEKVSTEEATEKKEEPAAEPAPPAEPEEVTMTLEEFRKSQKKSNRNPNAKLTEEKAASVAPKTTEARKKGRAARVEAVDLKIPSLGRRGGGDDRRGGRGGRRPNGPRGDRPKNENKKQEAGGYSLADDFPTLG